jgi:hypothetical protein
MKMFNIGKTLVYEILKKKTEILMWWENCGNRKIKREIKKTANEDEVTASVENENDQQDLKNCMNEAAFSNYNAEDFINIDKDVQTEQDTMDIDALVQNFRESQKGEEEVEEEKDEKDIVLEEEKWSVKTYQDAVKSLKELQEFAAQRMIQTCLV